MPEDPLEESSSALEKGIALCLSGGGYRAMVFHLGALIRLNEIGLLPRLSRISSVSGGSITSAYLGLQWKHLMFDADGRATNLDIVTEGIRRMAGTSVDTGAIIGGILLPGTISDKVAEAYDTVLFRGAMLADLPDDNAGPRFVINATNVQSATLWRFSKAYMGDYRVGLVPRPKVSLSTAVAASSAFPPVLSPLTLKIKDAFDPQYDGDLEGEGFRNSVVLSDGGVYDNLGLETAIKRYRTILVSDGGQKTAPEAEPANDWARHSIRILDIVDNQVRSLRKRRVIEDFRDKTHTGTYWGIRSDFIDYHSPSDPLGCSSRDPRPIAETPTRLQAIPDRLQEKLINWGYAIADTALRTHFAADLLAEYGIAIAEPTTFPYQGGY